MSNLNETDVMHLTDAQLDAVAGGVCQPCHVPSPTNEERLRDSVQSFDFSLYENIDRNPYYDYDAGMCRNPYDEEAKMCKSGS